MYKVEKNVHIPIGKPATTKKYPFGDMSIGESFLVPEGDNSNNVVRSAHAYGKRNGMKFTSRKAEGGTRIWRIE